MSCKRQCCMIVYALGLLYRISSGSLEETYVGMSYYKEHVGSFSPWQAPVILDHEL